MHTKMFLEGRVGALASILSLAAAGAGCGREPDAPGQGGSSDPARTAPALSHDDIAGPPAIVANDAERDLRETRVTAFLQAKHVLGKNLLWCGTFQIAWDELAGLLGGPVKLAGDPEMARALNARLTSKGDLDPASYVARAGFVGKGILGAIRADLERTFQGQASPRLLPAEGRLPPDAIVAYAYLFKNLAFKTPLVKDERPFHFGGTEVEGVGVWHKEGKSWKDMAEQVRILDYKDDGDFVLELKSQAAEDRLILARIGPGETLHRTVTTVLGRVTRGKPSDLAEDEFLEFPVLNFDVTRLYHEVTGPLIENPGFPGYYIALAIQNIRFRLDEKGAVLKSEALIGAPAANGHPAKARRPRQFIFNSPHLILMIRRDAQMPYFALWVDNAELLVKVK